MANNEKGNPPAPLEPQVVKRLLELLSTDDDFRELFAADAHAALVKAGYVAPTRSSAGMSLTESAAQSGGACLQLKPGATLASKEQIVEQSAKLETAISGIQGFMSPPELQAD